MLKTELFNCGNVPIAIKRGGISKHYITNSDKDPLHSFCNVIIIVFLSAVNIKHEIEQIAVGSGRLWKSSSAHNPS